MGILTRSADLVYTFRFLRLLTTPFNKTTAYQLGIIDDKGIRDKSVKVVTGEQKSAYNMFHKLVFNLKKLMAKVPGGGSKIASYAAALMLIKEHGNISDIGMDSLIADLEIDVDQMMYENSNWLILSDTSISPGMYKMVVPKVVNSTCEELVRRNDQVRIDEHCYPHDTISGVPVYKAIHIKSSQEIYVTAGEISK